jgi:molybdopterin synthase catalytic subunit
MSHAITHNPLSIDVLATGLERDVQARGEGCGAVCTFLGIVRATHKGRRVRHLEYEAFEPLAIKAFERIAGEIATEWPDARVSIHHRIGRLALGEASIVIVAASPHRGDAFSACRYTIERVKQIVPIWKHEHFDGGDVWLEGATADPDDETARQTAYRIACA